MDKLSAMATFVEIVDRGSLTAAAAGLGKSQPSVVRSLANLESTLGVRLLQRTTRRMSLTEEGRVYLERCRRILADVDEAEELLHNRETEPRGELRVTAPVQFGRMHVAPAVVGFLAQYPRVKVDLLLLDRIVNLVDEGIDVGVRIAKLADASMIARPVGEVRRVVCASPTLLKRGGTPAHPRELADRPCIQVGQLAPTGSWRFVDGRRPMAVRVDGPLISNQVGVALDACEQGLGFGWFLSYQVAPYLATGQLQVVLRKFEMPAVPVSLVFAHAKLMSARVRAFVDWMTPRLQTPRTG